jgi:hypothetical protein
MSLLNKKYNPVIWIITAILPEYLKIKPAFLLLPIGKFLGKKQWRPSHERMSG